MGLKVEVSYQLTSQGSLIMILILTNEGQARMDNFLLKINSNFYGVAIEKGLDQENLTLEVNEKR